MFHLYLEGIAGRVRGFGGDPTKILPSPTGDGIPKHRRHEEHEPRLAYTGKIAGLIFDRFGDFEGFLLDTEDGERKFFSREKEIEELAERAWRDRLRISVWAECDEPHRPLSIIVREPPAPFWHRSHPRGLAPPNPRNGSWAVRNASRRLPVHLPPLVPYAAASVLNFVTRV